MARSVGWLDTNLFVHAFTNDERTAACRALVEGLEDGSIEGWLHPIVLHELSYVLRNLFHWDRGKIAGILVTLVLAPGVRIQGDVEVLVHGILRWRDGTMAFADALLAAEASAAGLPVCSINAADMHRAQVSCIVPALRGGALQLTVLPPPAPPAPSSG